MSNSEQSRTEHIIRELEHCCVFSYRFSVVVSAEECSHQAKGLLLEESEIDDDLSGHGKVVATVNIHSANDRLHRGSSETVYNPRALGWIPSNERIHAFGESMLRQIRIRCDFFMKSVNSFCGQQR